MTWSEFRQQLFLAFSEDELETLCFDLNLDYEVLSGSNKNAKVRELIELMRRQHRMPELVAALNKARPHLQWDNILTAPAPHFFPTDQNGRIWLGVAATAIIAVVAVVLFYVFNNRPEPEIAATEIAAVADTPTGESSTNTPTSTSPPSATPSATAMATERPLPTHTPTETTIPAPVVAPIASDEIMVLVAQLEPFTANERDVTRFIVEDLTQILEVSIPFSNLRIREYPEVISSSSQALAVAEETGAAIIVWGHYDEDVADVAVQVGSLAAFPQMLFDRQLLEQTGNIRATVANPRQESLALWVANIGSLLIIAADISPAQSAAVWAEIQAILERTSKMAAPLIGDSVAVRVHHYAEALLKGDAATALSYLNEALDLGGGNPLLYYYRSQVFIQSGDSQAATTNLAAAIQIGPENWFRPQELLGFIALLQNDPQEALAHFEYGVQWRPEQWSSFYYLGLAYFLVGDYEQARVDLTQAIDLEPDVNWPYIPAIQVALRQGRLVDAINLGNIVLKEFPDPLYGNRVLESSFGTNSVIGPIISGFTNGLLQQWPQVLLDVEKAMTFNDQIPDVYWLQGFAYCNLDDEATAEAAYTTAVELDPTFVLPYLNRAGLRLHQGDTEGAEADFQAIADSELSAEFAPVIPFVRSGQLTCKNFLTFGQ